MFCGGKVVTGQILVVLLFGFLTGCATTKPLTPEQRKAKEEEAALENVRQNAQGGPEDTITQRQNAARAASLRGRR